MFRLRTCSHLHFLEHVLHQYRYIQSISHYFIYLTQQIWMINDCNFTYHMVLYVTKDIHQYVVGCVTLHNFLFYLTSNVNLFYVIQNDTKVLLYKQNINYSFDEILEKLSCLHIYTKMSGILSSLYLTNLYTHSRLQENLTMHDNQL